MSIHRYDNGSFFPHSKDADYTAVGEGRGVGYNINIPWNKVNFRSILVYYLFLFDIWII